MIIYTGSKREYIGKRRPFSVERYMGRWYDVAHKPFKFQATCQAQSIAEYRLLSADSVSITNRCGNQAARGVATIVNGDNMRFSVQFENQPPGPPGDYWIVMVDSARYKWAVVSNRDRSLLWILSRSKTLPRSTLTRIYAILQERGYPLEDLQIISD